MAPHTTYLVETPEYRAFRSAFGSAVHELRLDQAVKIQPVRRL
jgi:hypothetical protein